MKRIMTKRLFDGIDVDGNGSLDSEEMKQLFKDLGLELTQDQVATVMSRIDADGSGEIDFDEFFAWYVTSIMSGEHF